MSSPSTCTMALPLHGCRMDRSTTIPARIWAGSKTVGSTIFPASLHFSPTKRLVALLNQLVPLGQRVAPVVRDLPAVLDRRALLNLRDHLLGRRYLMRRFLGDASRVAAQHGFYARPRLRHWSIVWFADSLALLSRSGLHRRGHRLFGNAISFW